MTAAQATDARSIRAAGIVQSGGCTLLECGAVRVVDTQTGSGTPHYVLNGVCDCTDYRRGNRNCKHCIAAAAELARYAGETTRRGVWYKGEYYTAEQCDAFAAARAAQQTACPTCQGPTKEDLCWCGKSGWLKFRICVGNREHKATRI